MSKISASTVEYPKRLTAINDCTGALIKSRGTNQEEFASGWDAIWGKKGSDIRCWKCLDNVNIIHEEEDGSLWNEVCQECKKE